MRLFIIWFADLITRLWGLKNTGLIRLLQTCTVNSKRFFVMFFCPRSVWRLTPHFLHFNGSSHCDFQNNFTVRRLNLELHLWTMHSVDLLLKSCYHHQILDWYNLLPKIMESWVHCWTLSTNIWLIFVICYTDRSQFTIKWILQMWPVFMLCICHCFISSRANGKFYFHIYIMQTQLTLSFHFVFEKLRWIR